MKRKYLSAIVAGLALLALGLTSVGSASAARMQITGGNVFLAIYGNPGENGTSVPVGGGLGRNFGFGENMLFEARTGTLGTNLKIELEGGAISESEEAYIGGTLMSNTTGKNNPVGFTVQFVDLQHNRATNAKGEIVATPAYADTSDRPWLATVCSDETGTECLSDAQFGVKGAGGVTIQDVSINIGAPAAPLVVQGWVWGKWTSGSTTEAPCITLETPAAGKPTLVVTQSAAIPVGTKVKTVSGKACLLSANNDYYTGHHEHIELENKN